MIPCTEAWTLLGTAAAGWANTMLRGIMDGLSGLGYRTRALADDGTPDCQRDLGERLDRRIETGEPLVIIDINAGTDLRWPDDLMPRKFSFMVDHPTRFLDRMTPFAQVTTFGMVDRAHGPALADMGFDWDTVFFPHGGPEPDDDPRPMAERDIDILFAGNIFLKPGSPLWNGQLVDPPDFLARAIDKAYRQVAEARRGAYEAFTDACTGQGVDPGRIEVASLCQVLRIVEMYAEGARRHQVLSGLGDFNVHIAGQISDDGGPVSLPNATLHGEVTFDELLSLMGRTKILINSTPKFSDGSHERIWYGMAKGCAILTTPSRFLAESFTPDENILFMPDGPDELASRLGGLLADTARLDDIARAARPIYAAHHTWRERVKIIDRAVNPES